MIISDKKIFTSSLLLVAAVFFVNTCSAQFVYSIKGGLNLAQLEKTSPTYQVNKTGFHTGVGVGYKLQNLPLVLQAEILYTEKGYKYTKASDFRNSMAFPPVYFVLVYDFDYIQMPLLVKYTGLKNFGLGVGGSVSRLIHASSNLRENLLGDNYTKIDYGFLFDVSYQIKKLQFGARYDKSISEIHVILKDDAEFSTSNTLIGVNRVFQFYLGYSLK